MIPIKVIADTKIDDARLDVSPLELGSFNTNKLRLIKAPSAVCLARKSSIQTVVESRIKTATEIMSNNYFRRVSKPSAFGRLNDTDLSLLTSSFLDESDAADSMLLGYFREGTNDSNSMMTKIVHGVPIPDSQLDQMVDNIEEVFVRNFGGFEDNDDEDSGILEDTGILYDEENSFFMTVGDGSLGTHTESSTSSWLQSRYL